MRTLQGGLGFLVLALATATAAAGGLEWQEVVWRKGECIALMPGKASSKSEPRKTADGQTIESHFMVVDAKPLRYTMAYFVIPALKDATEEVITKTLDDFRSASVGKNKLLKEDEFKHGSYAGRELRIEMTKKVFNWQRLFIVDNKLYMLVVSGPLDAANSKNADKFFTSFKLLK